MAQPPAYPLSLRRKLRLAARVWLSLVHMRLRMLRSPLPRVAESLADGRPRRYRSEYSPATLSRAVHRWLQVGGRRPTCLISSLVLMDLLRGQGEPAELVIGLPPQAADHRAHAWVELEGRDVGPPPGRGEHVPLARFGGD